MSTSRLRRIALLISLLALSLVSARPADPILVGPESVCGPVLLLALLVECPVILLCAYIRHKPRRSMLLAAILANVISVTGLSVWLMLGPLGSVLSMVSGEIAVWFFEAVFLHGFRGTGITWPEAATFSLVMNLGSLAAGWGLVALLQGLSAPA